MTLRTDLISEFMAGLTQTERAMFAQRDREQQELDEAGDSSELPPIPLGPESEARFAALCGVAVTRGKSE